LQKIKSSGYFLSQYNLDETYQDAEVYDDPSLVHYTQRQLEDNMNASSSLKNH
jgi:hypothetical protein